MGIFQERNWSRILVNKIHNLYTAIAVYFYLQKGNAMKKLMLIVTLEDGTKVYWNNETSRTEHHRPNGVIEYL